MPARGAPDGRSLARHTDRLERRFIESPEEADRLGQSALDLFGSPVGTVFLNYPSR